jgi:hypothetical protein
MMRARRRVADTTCLSTLAGFLLLAVVLGYSRRIVRIELIPEALWRSGSAGPRT